MLFDLFVNILIHNLAEPAYEADVAQLEYKLMAGEHGLVVKVKGFNHKLPVSTVTHRVGLYKELLSGVFFFLRDNFSLFAVAVQPDRGLSCQFLSRLQRVQHVCRAAEENLLQHPY